MSEMINDELLKKVSGGANAQPDDMERQFEAAWSELGMEAQGYTGTELEDVYAQCQNAGYRPDARTFIENCKTL